MKRILIVDDSRDIRIILRGLFEHQGYGCEEATNGLEALTWLEETHFDLVIIDQRMPILGGLEFLQYLSARFKRDVPPVIMLSGTADAKLREQALQAGARAFLQKPCDSATLLSTIEALLQPSRVGKELSYSNN